MCWKILGIDLSPKLPLTDQMVQDSLKSSISRMASGMKYIFCNFCEKSTDLSLTWLGMPRLIQNYTWGIHYSKDKYGQVSFWYLTSVNRESYKFTDVCLSLTTSVGHFNISSKNQWLVLFLIFQWRYIILTTKKWELKCYRKFIFDRIWITKVPK